jgi:hypothetical protein
MKPRIRQALFVSCVTVLLALAFGLAGSAGAGEFKRFPEYAYDAKQESDVEALKELLRQAQELQKTENETKATDAKDAKAEAAAAVVKADADTAAEKRGSSAQAGCMYRDSKLIWEKKPGTCKP